MSTKNKISVSFVGIATAATLMLGALPASALNVSTTVSAAASGSGVGVSANASVKLADVIAKADSDIAARIAALNALNTRVQAMKNESAAGKASIAAQIQTNITGLTALKTKIDADTDTATARSDAQTIFGTYRIYALVVPQGWILAASDRVATVTSLMTTLGTKIQARITADQAAGKDVSALTSAYADMQAKIADANKQSASAQAGVSALVPDQGNATLAASNKAALVAARADIKTATSDLVAARKDVATLLKDLKSLGGNGAASASTSASAQ
jgi:hypothetical protein